VVSMCGIVSCQYMEGQHPTYLYVHMHWLWRSQVGEGALHSAATQSQFVVKTRHRVGLVKLGELIDVMLGRAEGWTMQEIRCVLECCSDHWQWPGEQRTLAPLRLPIVPVGCQPVIADWMRTLLVQDGMVDSFVAMRPHARDRFTCWHQYTNQRYVNNGSRIDFVLLDECLVRFLRKGGDLYGANEGCPDADSPQAARNACVAHGLWKMAAYDGSGIDGGTRKANDAQFVPPHTGIIYTPPRFSDHVAVSALLDDAIFDQPTLLPSSSSSSSSVAAAAAAPVGRLFPAKHTRATQPHRKQKSISSFFGSGSAHDTHLTPAPTHAHTQTSSTSSSSSSSSRFTAQKRKKKGSSHALKAPARKKNKKKKPPPPNNATITGFFKKS
jgi:hypothetical protein